MGTGAVLAVGGLESCASSLEALVALADEVEVRVRAPLEAVARLLPPPVDLGVVGDLAEVGPVLPRHPVVGRRLGGLRRRAPWGRRGPAGWGALSGGTYVGVKGTGGGASGRGGRARP
eukprot:7345066-Alexandrium_andersonii.AAC.1